MHRNRLAPALAFGAFALVGVPTLAWTQEAEPATAVVERIRLVDTVRVPTRGRLAGAAADFVRASAAAPGLDRSAWTLRSVTRGADGLDHVRLDQLHEGIRVWGGNVVVHTAGDEVRGVHGTFVRKLEGVATVPAFSAKEALAAAQADYAAAVPAGSHGLAYERESVELVILPRDGQPARLAWHATFFTELQGGMAPGLWHYFVDAQTGEVLKKINAIDTLSQASGPGGNPNIARQWVSQLDVEPSGSQFRMATSRLVTTNMRNSTSGGGTVVTGPLNPIGDAAINDAHGFAEITLAMLAQMGHNSIDDAGKVIRSRVHYGSGFENAFWDGSQMTYGDGSVKFFALSGDLDVVAHEINHGFTTFHSGLIYEDQPGGLNESFSDVAGTVAEFFNEGATADFDLGRDIMRNGSALRFMCDPRADGLSIDHASQYFDGIDPHFSSGVGNKAFCRAARRFSSGSPTGRATPAGVRRAGLAWFAANAGFWTESTDFVGACHGLLDAARLLGFTAGEVEAIRQSWVDVGVVCEVPMAVPPADYDGDGRTDIAVKDGAGVWRIDFSANGFGAFDVSLPGYGPFSVPVPADYDGDGRADLSVKGTTDGIWYIDFASNGFGTWDAAFPGYGTTSVPVPADYDGDGKADLSVKGATDGIWYIDFASNGFGRWDASFPGYGTTSVPVPADYDGDGRADLSVKGATDGIWYIDFASNGFGRWDASFPGYGTTSVPVPADYDGDGKADLSVKGATDGIWYIDFASNGFGSWNASFLGYGTTSVPVPADYDGDGKADLSVTDSAVTTWFLDFAAGGFGAWNRIIPLR